MALRETAYQDEEIRYCLETATVSPSRCFFTPLYRVEDDETLYAQPRYGKAIVMSPVSITIALGMLAGGASEEDRTAFALALCVSDPGELAQNFDILSEELVGSFTGMSLEFDNGVFHDHSCALLPAFAEYIETFQAEVISYPKLSESVDDMNKWIADHTRGLIRSLLDPVILSGIHITLVDTLAFKGKWRFPFARENPIVIPVFRKSKTGRNRVTMMFKHKQKYLTLNRPSYSAIRIPYEASSDADVEPKVSTIAYLPDENEDLNSILPELCRSSREHVWEIREVAKLGFPRIHIDSRMSIQDSLRDLGFALNGAFPNLCTTKPGLI